MTSAARTSGEVLREEVRPGECYRYPNHPVKFYVPLPGETWSRDLERGGWWVGFDPPNPYDVGKIVTLIPRWDAMPAEGTVFPAPDPDGDPTRYPHVCPSCGGPAYVPLFGRPEHPPGRGCR